MGVGAGMRPVSRSNHREVWGRPVSGDDDDDANPDFFRAHHNDMSARVSELPTRNVLSLKWLFSTVGRVCLMLGALLLTSRYRSNHWSTWEASQGSSPPYSPANALLWLCAT